MKIAFEIIGTFIVSLLLMAVPVLCPLSFVYDWFAGSKFILIVACIFEYFGLACLLTEVSDIHDKR